MGALVSEGLNLFSPAGPHVEITKVEHIVATAVVGLNAMGVDIREGIR